MIKYLENDIKRLNTELAYKEGYLHCRGILEKCEKIHCTPQMLSYWTREDRWVEMFNTQLKIIKSKKPFENSTNKELATQVACLYKTLSDRVHDSYGTSIKKLHINSVSVFEAQIIAFVCDQIGILWESDIINSKYKRLNKHKMENATKRLNITTTN